MNALSTFLEMGGYAAFVWPCYLLSGLVLCIIAVCSVRSLRAARATLRDLENSETETL